MNHSIYDNNVTNRLASETSLRTDSLENKDISMHLFLNAEGLRVKYKIDKLRLPLTPHFEFVGERLLKVNLS